MIVEATNCNRTYAAKAQSLAADFVSHVVDFKDMPMGSVQAIWTGAAGSPLGTFKIYASDVPDLTSFDLDGTTSSGDTPGRITFSTTTDGGTSVTERMRIDNAGAVTIADTGGNGGHIPHRCNTVTTNGDDNFTIACAAGEMAVTGGCSAGNAAYKLNSSNPVFTSTNPPTGWQCVWQAGESTSNAGYAVCCDY